MNNPQPRHIDEEERLAHGYTNATSVRCGHVIKRYLGPDPVQRQRAETTALRCLAGLVQIPPVINDAPGEVVLGFVDGVHGQELLEAAPERVLVEVGRTAARLKQIDVTGWGLDATPGGTVLVHGDFGPQNILFDSRRIAVTAILDWETAHIGAPVEDIAWAEWILRFHHPHLVWALPSLFSGFGETPKWSDRQAAMIRKCRWAADFVERWGLAGTTLWKQRLDITAAFRE